MIYALSMMIVGFVDDGGELLTCSVYGNVFFLFSVV